MNESGSRMRQGGRLRRVWHVTLSMEASEVLAGLPPRRASGWLSELVERARGEAEGIARDAAHRAAGAAARPVKRRKRADRGGKALVALARAREALRDQGAWEAGCRAIVEAHRERTRGSGGEGG